ncbi:DUF4382 domain-containing protein [Fulvivirga sp. 29W222]|uniref:DUF4382 domain-containing protein n=1 Tax=Fulvivirga marina TaxID=2494733 RepID=A0A937KAT2_9BACT|nr:DUF4382 domain-containing protein [Fulvivirga marina]MBL6445022.1 DUF4382 domain-containing protein [Fulvivirga marina]
MKMLKMLSVVFLSAMIFTACNDDNTTNGKGKASIYITDAPIDDDNVAAVIISVNSVEANGPEGWETIDEFEEPVDIDLLSYQNGEAFLLTENEMDAGTYSEVRLILNIQEKVNDQIQNEGSYIEYLDGSKEPLFVPSGGQSGYKAKGEFTIPVGGVVGVTLDFDVRKAVVKAGNSGNFILKPTIRLIANQDAAMINGHFEPDNLDSAGYNKVVAFAYENDTFTESETNEPAEGEIRFPNAVTSSVIIGGDFTLAFMKSGTYDLYFASYDENGGYVELIGSYQDVTLEAGTKLELDLELNLLN